MALVASKGYKKNNTFQQQHPLVVIGTDFFGSETVKDLQQIVDDTITSLKKKCYLTCPTVLTLANAKLLLKAAASTDIAQVQIIWGLHQAQPGAAVVGGGAVNPGTHQHFTVSYTNINWHLYLPDKKGKRRNIVGLSSGPLAADFVTVENV